MISTSGQFMVNIIFKDQAQTSAGTLKKTATVWQFIVFNWKLFGTWVISQTGKNIQNGRQKAGQKKVYTHKELLEFSHKGEEESGTFGQGR